jgi:poly-gamma-glutamate capsule biosynthesis protein CapA/YwtB (metallophosphatase superfamily)
VGSPYPLHYTLCWLYYHLRPSIKNYTQLSLHPLSHKFDSFQGEKTCRLFFLGDIMCIKHDKVPKVDPALREMLSGADLVIGGCEAPVTHKSVIPNARYLIIFQMAEDFLHALLEQLGVNPGKCVLSVANNHIGDQGKEGLAATLKHLDSIGITPVGDFRSGEPPVVKIALKELVLGISAWTHWLNCDIFQKNSGVWRTRDVSEHSWLETKKHQGIDCLIGLPHWEYEFQHFPRAETRVLAHQLVQGGFDILVGHHPHVVQPVELLSGSICLYSIGDLCGFHLSWPNQLVSIFEVHVCSSGSNRGQVAGYTLHPFVQVTTGDEVSIVPLEKAPVNLKKKLENRLELLFGNCSFNR